MRGDLTMNNLMIGKCEECGFEGHCISVINDLCAECDENVEMCNNCECRCRLKEEQERIFKNMGLIK
jgi:hypothetical protein